MGSPTNVVAGVAHSPREETAGQTESVSVMALSYGDLSGRDVACSDDCDDDDDGVDGNSVPVRNRNAIVAAWLALERVVGVRLHCAQPRMFASALTHAASANGWR